MSTRPAPAGAHASPKAIVPWLVAVAFIMASLDTTILNTAVPTIAAALGIAPLSMKAVLSSYTRSLAVFIPVSGWVADRFGTRRVFASAIGIFTLGAILCGISTDVRVLVACRVLLGMGGAMMVPVGRLTMVRTFPKHELVRALAFVAIPALSGPMLGPVAGGLIVRFFHWRVSFVLIVPFGAVGLFMVWRNLPDYRAARVDRLDYTGLCLFGCGVALLSYVLEVFGEHRLGTLEILGLLAIALTLLFVYTRYALAAPHPLLRLQLLRLLMPRLLRRYGYRRVLLANTTAIAILMGLFALVGPHTPVWVIVAQAFCFGFFSSFQYTSTNTLSYADIDEADTSMASTMASTTQQLSISFGVAAASLTAAVFIPDRFNASAAQTLHGIHLALFTLAVLTLVSSALFRTLRSGDGDAVSRHESIPNVVHDAVSGA